MVEPSYPHYHRIPTDLRENLRWRIAVAELALEDAEFAADIRQMCEEDLLFWLIGFAWVFEPRAIPPAPKILPFILYPHQIQAAKTLDKWWGIRDMVVVKSRTQGASWLVYGGKSVHSFLFHPNFAMGVMSRDEPSVDIRGNVSKLIPKMDFQLAKQPVWLRPEKLDRIQMQLGNPDNGALIEGEAATGDAFSGDRKLVVAKDESAKFPKNLDSEVEDSLQHVTNCRIDISTPKGDVGVFFEKAHDPEIIRIEMHWTDNPVNNRGMYDVTAAGEILPVDPENNPIPREYLAKIHDEHARLEQRGFKIEGTRRSPWYNNECLRSTPLSIAQELDMSFGRSAEKAFDRDVIKSLVTRHARAPVQTGKLHVEDDLSVRFQSLHGGRVSIWCPLGGPDRRPPKRNYGVGGDVALGTGGAFSSNSVLIVGDLHTGEQVFEFASNSIKVTEFARLAAAVCRWFWDAVINWDSNGGPGVLFTQELMERYKYYNVHFTHADQMGANRTSGNRPGTFHHDDESKSIYLTDTIEDALTDQVFFRSEATLKEFGEFGYKGGKLVHLKADRTKAEGAKGKAHGDRATAAAMFNIVRRQLGYGQLEVPERPPDPHGPLVQVPWSCPANRYLAHERRTRQKEPWT